MPDYTSAVSTRVKRSKREAKERKARQMAGMRHLAQITRSPAAPPFYMAGEVKAVDLLYATYTLNTTAQVTPINVIRTGSTFCNRIGRKIEMKSVHAKFALQSLRTTAATEYLRIMIVYDAQTNGAAPAISDIIQDTDQATTNETISYSSANLNNRDRFKILCDWRIVAPSCTNTAGVLTNIGLVDPTEPIFDLTRFIKLRGLVTQYKADSSPAVVGDIATGGLFLITYGNVASASEGFRLAGTVRLRYRDA